MSLLIKVFLKLKRKGVLITRRDMLLLGSLLPMNITTKKLVTLSIGLKPIPKSETEQYLF